MMLRPTRTHVRTTTALAAALLAGAALGGGVVAWAKADVTLAPAPAPVAVPTALPTASPLTDPAGFAPLVTKVKPAVVNIATTAKQEASQMPEMPNFPPGSPFSDMFQQFFQHQRAAPKHALGSGFIIDLAGYIVTNNHVVDDATEIVVTLDDGSDHKAKVIGRDQKTDLALLKIDSKTALPYVSFGDSDAIHVGNWIVAMGNPFGLGGTVTAGIVSAHDRNINAGPYDDFLQIDAPINPGNSGGPLFNLSGQVVGVDSAIYTPNGGNVGIGFAIPSNIVSNVVAQLREHGHVERGWLGVQMQPVTKDLAEAMGLPDRNGVIVNEVLPDSPAHRAKLAQGDVITAFDGKTIQSPRDLALDVANAHAGEKATLTVWRSGRERKIDVTIDMRKEQQANANQGEEKGEKLGLELAPLTDTARAELKLGPSVKGVLVQQVTPGSKADDSGIQSGDVIVRIGNDPVASPAQAATKIRKAETEKKSAVPLLVTRNGTTYYLALELAQG